MPSIRCRSLRRGIVTLVCAAGAFGAALPAQLNIGREGVAIAGRDPAASASSTAIAGYTSDTMSATYGGGGGGSGSVATQTSGAGGTTSHPCIGTETPIPARDIAVIPENDMTLEVLSGCTLAVGVLIFIFLGVMAVRTHMRGRRLDGFLQQSAARESIGRPAPDTCAGPAAGHCADIYSSKENRDLTIDLERAGGMHEEGEGCGRWSEKGSLTPLGNARTGLPTWPLISMSPTTPISSYGSSPNSLVQSGQVTTPPRPLPQPGAGVLRGSRSDPAMRLPWI